MFSSWPQAQCGSAPLRRFVGEIQFELGKAHDLHLGAGPLCGRIAQIVHTLQLTWRLTSERANYSYVLVDNFFLPVFLAGVYAKYVLGKSLYVEYQDDYTTKRKSWVKNLSSVCYAGPAAVQSA